MVSFTSLVILPILLFGTSGLARPACERPAILLPTGAALDVTVNTRRVLITGTSDCPFVNVQVTTQSLALVPVINGKFSYYTYGLTNGRYSISVSATSDKQGSDRSLGIARTMAVVSSETCGRPTIIEPTRDALDVTIFTRRPLITGESDCPFATVQVTTHATVTVPVINGKFSHQPEALMNGRFAISVAAVSNKQGSYKSAGIARTMRIASLEPGTPVSSAAIDSAKLITPDQVC
jgi:hypothetical protein